MKLCDWCGEGVPEDENDFITLKPEHWPYSHCKNRKVAIELHDECLGALLGILRESDMPRPTALPKKQSALRALRSK